jgi:hypothetical protein
MAFLFRGFYGNKVMTNEQSIDDARLTELAGPAMRAFTRICEVWGITKEQQRTLLDASSIETLDQWRSGGEAIPVLAVERIGHILGIYKELHLLFSVASQADSWIHRPNNAPLFRGATALSLMLADPASALPDVRRYLQAKQ